MTVLTSGAGGGGPGKTVQLVSGAHQLVNSAGQQQQAQQVVMGGTSGQQMVVMQQGVQPTASVTSSDGPVTSDAALAQLAAEAGLLEGEGEGVAIQLPEGTPQVDGGMVTPQEGEISDMSRIDLSQYLNMFNSQLDGDPGDETTEDEAPPTTTTAADAETPAVVTEAPLITTSSVEGGATVDDIVEPTTTEAASVPTVAAASNAITELAAAVVEEGAKEDLAGTAAAVPENQVG